MTNSKLFYFIFGVIITLLTSYFFLWGKPYLELESKYNQLVNDHYQLNLTYNSLQQNYTNLQKECSEVLTKYQQCIGKEDFFTWIDRFLSLRSLAILLGLI